MKDYAFVLFALLFLLVLVAFNWNPFLAESDANTSGQYFNVYEGHTQHSFINPEDNIESAAMKSKQMDDQFLSGLLP